MLQENHAVNAAGHLEIAGVDAVALAEEYGTPLYVMDEDLVRRNMRAYRTAMETYLPAGSMPLLASKALSCKEIYRIALEEGIGTDIVSSGELYTALAAGFPADRMCFHGSAKTTEDIRFGMEAGVRHFVVDSTEELGRISRRAAETGREQHVLLRLTPGIDPHTFDAVATGRVDSKFGAAIETGQARALALAALEAPGVALDGFHCHIGSMIFDVQPYLDAVDIMTGFFAALRDETGFETRIFNIGGGIGVPYVAADPAADPADFIRAIAARLTERCRGFGMPVPAVFMEPGRSIVAAAGVTLYRVQSIKEIPCYKRYVAVDGGMTDNPRYALYGARYSAVVANRAGEPADYVAAVAGRNCENDDLIGEDIPMQTPRPDDVLAVLVTGAYNYSMASNYNRVPRPPLVMLRDGQARVVVRRETFEDIVALDI